MHAHLEKEIKALKKQGLFKIEHEITSPQSSHIQIAGGKTVINFASNNYLGLANHPDLIQAAIMALHRYGLGCASVRFISGTQTLHHTLEKKISSFLHTEESILYSSCFDANGGLFEALFGSEDAIFSDEMNHASIIDGIRLSKAMRYRYRNLEELEEKLQISARYKIIATDGVFSMDGKIADLKRICDLAEKYHSLVMVDDSHGIGVLGARGRGSIESVLGRVDLITGTFGKALGGAAGGYISGRKEMIEWLRQKSRPYLFSNALAPCIAGAAIKAFEILESSSQLRERLHENTQYFRKKIEAYGFNTLPGEHPIIPLLLGNAKLAQTFAQKLLELGIYVVGFFYPVVPEGQARLRVQISALHSKEDLDQALQAFNKVGQILL